MANSKALLGDFLRTNPQDAYLGDTSEAPYANCNVLAEVFIAQAQATSTLMQGAADVLEACEQLQRQNAEFLMRIIQSGQEIFDGYGTLIFITRDPALVCELLDALDERHFGPSLTGCRPSI